VAFGIATRGIRWAKRGRGWPNPDKWGNFVGVEWEVLILDNPIDRDHLEQDAPGFCWKRVRASAK